MSAFYYLEIIEAKKGNDIVRWFYEGRDLFSKEGTNTLVTGDEVIKELWELLEKGYTATGTTKETKTTNFTSTKDLLVYCFKNVK